MELQINPSSPTLPVQQMQTPQPVTPDSYQAAVWYQPGLTIATEIHGTLTINKTVVSLADDTNQAIFSLPLSTINQATVHPGRIDFITNEGRHNIFFYNPRKEAGKVYAGIGVVSAGNLLTKNAPINLASDATAGALARSGMKDIKSTSPLVLEAKRILQQNGVTATGSTSWKTTYMILGGICLTAAVIGVIIVIGTSS